MTRVSWSTRTIVNSIRQLQKLETTLQTKARQDKADAHRILSRAAAIETDKLIARLEKLVSQDARSGGQTPDAVVARLQEESDKRRKGQLTADDCSKVEKAAKTEFKGAMVAFYPSASVAKKLVVADGQAAEQLHVTLLYFPFEDNDEARISTELAGIVADTVSDVRALRAKVSGTGVLRTGSDDEVAVTALISAPYIEELRQRLLDAATDAGFKASRKYSFTPHITVTYAKNANAANYTFDPLEFELSDLRLVGNNETLGTTKLK